MKPWLSLVCAAILIASIALALSYIVKPGDTLSSIARQFAVSVSDLRRINNLTGDELRVGQSLQIPSSGAPPSSSPDNLVTVRGAVSGATVSHRATAIPGDPVLVRVSDVPAVTPLVKWGSEELVMTRDGEDWVGIGRELLGVKPKVIALRVNLGSEVISSSLKLMPDPQAIQNVFMSKQVLSTLTDKNRNVEYAVLNAAHAKSVITSRLWMKTFIWPVLPHRSISPFAQARLYQLGGKLNFHYGEDMAGKVGDPIRASNDGVVEIAGQYAIRGGLTGINHGAGVVSLYFHQSQILVKVGQRVSRGQLIGRIGATGFVTGPHLHWEMRVRAEATDPRQWADRIFPR